MKIDKIKQTIQLYEDGLICHRELIFNLHENLNELTLELLSRCNQESICYSKENACHLLLTGDQPYQIKGE